MSAKKWLLFVVAVSLGVVWFFLQAIEGVPSDEKIIRVFRENQENIKSLVQEYREADSEDWVLQESVKKALRAAKIYRVSLVSPVWGPHPYSVEEKKKFLKDFDSLRELCGEALSRCYSVAVELDVGGGDKKFYYDISNFNAPVLYKEIVNYPYEPDVRNGEIVFPVNHYSGVSSTGMLLDNLDEAKGLRRGECVYRLIDIQWYIRLCGATI